MNKGLRVAVAVVLLIGILVLARGQMAWAGGIPAPISDVQTGFAQAGATPAPTQASGSTLTAKLSEITGPVQVKQAQDLSFADAKLGYVLDLLGQVQTQSAGKVRLDFSTGTIVRLGPGTLFTLQPAADNSQGLGARLQLAAGQIWVILKGGSLQVETPSGVAAVQGSYMSVTYDPFRITCLEGHCTQSNAAGTIELTSGQTGQADGPNQHPQIGNMTDKDYQDWAGNSPESAGLVRQASTVQVPSSVLPPVSGPGTYGVAGICTFRVITLAADDTLNADLLQYSSLGARPDNIAGYQAGVCRAIYSQVGVGVIDALGSDSQVQICFAGVQAPTGKIYVYNDKTWTPLTTTADGGLLCAPAQQTGKYVLVTEK